IGECRTGTTTCTSGLWGGCDDEALPVTEVCGDTTDGDCDGRPDGITFLEDFEDDCSVPEATVTTDVPFDCVETPADAVDPSRTPEGDQSLRLQLAYVDRNIETIIEWQFSACIPDANGSATLYATTVPQGSAGLFFHPVFEGRGVQFRYTTDGAIAVAVDSEDGGSDVYVQPFTLGTNQWRTISWSFVAAGGTIAYALDGATFFEEQITGTVDGVFLRSQVSGANAEIDMLVDDVRFSSP
ncbi:MAG: hypothetical protein Q7S02_02915, partial [bacterium]|nr:hypothetical protein [bacterium]